MDRGDITTLINKCRDISLLYVEDNQDVRESTVEVLGRFFQNISTAKDGKDGLEKFKNGEYDLIITDINMPNMSGLDMVKEIRKIKPEVSVIIISAHSESGYFMEAIRQDIDGYLLKPIGKQFFTQILKSVEKIWLTKEHQAYKKDLEIQVDERTKAFEYVLYHDGLTGLKNKNALLEDIESDDFTALLVVDIDNLDDFNDFYGLSGGNKIIERFAKVLESEFDGGPYWVYHFHNDQFIIRMKRDGYDINSFEMDIKEIIEKISSFKIYLDEAREFISIDITIGVSFEKDYAIEKSMMALKYAKKHKRTYSVYSSLVDRGEISKESLFWKDEIKKALNSNNIVPVFQPIVNRDREVVKYEALMRLVQIEDKEEKMVSPFLFLDIAKKSKQYPKLTEALIEKSFSTMGKLNMSFSINLSFEDIINPQTIRVLKEQIDRYKIGRYLILEIVESESVEDYEVIKSFIKDFRKLGVRVAIDDFGAGFSSYAHILEIEPDYLKLDGSMIKDIDKSQKLYEFVKSIVQLTKALGIKTIAEFVHSKEVFDICLELGIDQFQGYYFSPPIREDELKDHLSIKLSSCIS